MLRIIRSMRQLSFSELMNVYIESNLLNGKELYPTFSQDVQILEAEQNFYHYLNDVFFRQVDSFYGIWEQEGRYTAALRIEPYSDGFLLCALETEPSARRRGYASNLIIAVIKYLEQFGTYKLYSHISKRNIPSINAHKKCGFHIISDHAVYSDGSVLHNNYTLLYINQKSET